MWEESIKSHDDNIVGTNGPNNGNVPFLPPHLVAENLSRKLKYALSTALTAFVFICIVVISTATRYLPPPEPRNSRSLSFSEPFCLLDSTGTLSRSTGTQIDPTGALSTGGPVSSLAEEKSGFYGKFELEEVGSGKPTLHIHIYKG